MITSEITYLLLVTFGIIISVSIIGFRHVLSVSAPATWFLVAVSAAYWFRPISFFIGDDWIVWNSMKLPPFNEICFSYGLFIFLSLVCFSLGYGRSLNMAAYIKTEKVKMPPHAKKVIIAVIILFSLVGYFFAYKFKPLPGIGEGVNMYRTYAGSSVYEKTSGYWVNAYLMTSHCCVLYYALSRNILNTFILTIPFLLIQFYQGWGRGHFLLLIISLLALSGIFQCYFRNRMRQVLALSIVFLMLLPIVAVLGRDRDYFKKTLDSRERTYQFKKAQERWISSESSDIHGFANSAFYLYHSGRTFPHAYCRPLIYTIFIQPIPRSLWRNKPLPNEFDNQYSAPVGMAPGPFGSAYHQLGWFGVLLFWFHGWWIKRLAMRLVNVDRPSMLAGFAFIVTQPIFHPDFLWLPNLPFFLAPALVVFLVERRYLTTITDRGPQTFPARIVSRWKKLAVSGRQRSLALQKHKQLREKTDI